MLTLLSAILRPPRSTLFPYTTLSDLGVRRAVREVDHPLAGSSVVPCRGGQLRHALAGEGQHRQRLPRPAAADLGPGELGSAHPGTPVTRPSRMPSAPCQNTHHICRDV